MKVVKKVIILLFILMMVLMMILSSLAPVRAEEENGEEQTQEEMEGEEEASDIIILTEGAPNIGALSGVAIDLTSGNVLYKKNPEVAYNPGTLNKLISAYLGLDKLGLRGEVTCSEDAIFGFDRSNTHSWFTTGEVTDAKGLAYASVMGDANDATRSLAQGAFKTEEGAIAAMNEFAQGLGLKNTWFTNTTGIYTEDQYTSAYDMICMLRKALDNKDFEELLLADSYAMAPTNKQPAVRNYTTNFMKTARFIGGFQSISSLAGNHLVAVAKENDTEVLLVIMAGESRDNLYVDANTMMDYVFANYRTYKIHHEDIEPKVVDVKQGNKLAATVTFSCNHDFSLLLRNNQNEEDVHYSIEVTESNSAERIQAYLVLYLGKDQIGEVEMEKQVEEFDTSFEATTLPFISMIFDYFCVGVLGVILAIHGYTILSKVGRIEE